MRHSLDILGTLAELTRSLGGEPRRLLWESGIDRRAEADQDSCIGFSELCDLLERTATATGCDTVGLRLSQSQGIDSLGTIGFAMQHGSTMRDAHSELRPAGNLAGNVMRGLLGPAWNPSRIDFIQSAPADTAFYRRVFRAPSLFQQNVNCMAFPLRELDRSIERSNPALRRLLQRHLMQPLTQLAAILGYSELSAFSRAFHRWHGQSPQAWQRSHVSGS